MKNHGSAAARIALKALCVVLVLAFCALSVYSAGDLDPKDEAAVPSVSPTPIMAPAPTPTPTPTPTPEPEYFTITMIGDCTLSSPQTHKGTAAAYETVVGDDYAYPFAKTIDYFNDDDFTIANLECVLSDGGTQAQKTFVFRSSPDYAPVMSGGRVEFVTLGNNHVLDYGEEGYADTKAALDEVGVAYAGRDEWTIYETESGLKIGVYAVSFGTTEQIEAGIAALKDAGAALIRAALHCGDEGSYDVNGTQRAQGHAAIDAGADVVYGSHPHTLQECEEYNGGYIYYSMGNWTFGGNTNPRDKDTVIVKLTVMRDLDGTVSIADREHIPCASSGDKNANNYQPVPYEEGTEEYERTLSKLDGTFDGANLSIGYDYTIGELND